MRHRLSHHNLRVYDFARHLASIAHRYPPRDTELRNQARRAAISVVLNIAEGAGLDGRASKRHFQIAKGSALETVAAYELAADMGESVPLDRVLRVGHTVAAMLTRLTR
jgi:four helix bundle protein